MSGTLTEKSDGPRRAEGFTESSLTERIRSLGGELYIVGGWVRDSLIGRGSYDKDYAVCGLTAENVSRGLGAVSVGRGFPVFVLCVDGRPCEIALARTEVKSGAGYRGFAARFEPSTTIEDDLFRRDTTMNSMALHLPDMALIDPFGGAEDIGRGLIRATSLHFREDPVRALRAARQSAQLGFSIERGTLALMAECRDELLGEPWERVRAEMTKALASPFPRAFFDALTSTGLTDALRLPFARDEKGYSEAMEALTRAAGLSGSAGVRYAALVCTACGALGAPLPQGFPKELDRLARLTLCALDAERRGFKEDVVRFFDSARRLAVGADDVKAAFRAVRGSLPDWLERSDAYERAIDCARSEAEFPPGLPQRERARWLEHEIAESFARYLG